MISGWLFDIYPLDKKMVFWIKREDGSNIRLEDNSWSHSIYVASDYNSYLKSVVLDSNGNDANDSIVYADTDSVFIKRTSSAIDYNELIDTLSKEIGLSISVDYHYKFFGFATIRS